MRVHNLSNAIELARHLHCRLLVAQHVQRLEYIEKTIVDAKSGNSRDIPKSISCSYVDPLPSLIDYITTSRRLSVKIETMDLCGGVTALAFMPTEKQVVVRVQKQLSFCVKRFAILKELLHYIEADLASTDTSESSLSISITAAIECRNRFVCTSIDLHPEAFCYYSAIEMLLWWGNRGKTRRQLLAMHEANVPNYVLACAYRVPLYVVQYFFDDDSRYAGMSYLLNSQIQ